MMLNNYGSRYVLPMCWRAVFCDVVQRVEEQVAGSFEDALNDDPSRDEHARRRKCKFLALKQRSVRVTAKAGNAKPRDDDIRDVISK